MDHEGIAMEQEAPKPATNSVRSIFTRSKANEGIRVDLKDFPGSNWVRVRGADSDAVQEAVLAFYRRKGDGDEGKKGGPFEDIAVLTSMVAAWSYDESPTVEVLTEAFKEAPSLRVSIVNASLERDNFFDKQPENFSGTPTPTSD